MKPGLLVALLTALAIGAAQATPLTFSFSGTVDNDPFGVFGSATFDGVYTFDSGIPEVLSTPNSRGFADTGSAVSMTVSFTGTLDPSIAGPYVADTLNISVNNDFPGPLDQYLVTGTSSIDNLLAIELTLDDFTGTAFSTLALPLTPPSLSAFTSVRFALFDGALDNPVEAEGALRTLECVAGCRVVLLPEPCTLLVLVAALGALGLSRKMRHATSARSALGHR
jgi:hypothetical protein